MRKEVLNLTPTRFLCPNCGLWHKWPNSQNLGYYNSRDRKAELGCARIQAYTFEAYYRIYFYEDYLYYSTEPKCPTANLKMNRKIPISSILEDPDRCVVKFETQFRTYSRVGTRICRKCDNVLNCNCARLGEEGDGRNLTITFGFEFSRADYYDSIKASKS